ncbi:hypothetical protein [Psychrobacillus sp. FSL H8-0510]
MLIRVEKKGRLVIVIGINSNIKFWKMKSVYFRLIYFKNKGIEHSYATR